MQGELPISFSDSWIIKVVGNELWNGLFSGKNAKEKKRARSKRITAHWCLIGGSTEKTSLGGGCLAGGPRRWKMSIYLRPGKQLVDLFHGVN